MGLTVDEASYCNSKNRPALDAVGVVTDLVVVRVSNTKAARESFVESGVEEKDRNDDRRCERTVVFPDPDSPLDFAEIVSMKFTPSLILTYLHVLSLVQDRM